LDAEQRAVHDCPEASAKAGADLKMADLGAGGRGALEDEDEEEDVDGN